MAPAIGAARLASRFCAVVPESPIDIRCPQRVSQEIRHAHPARRQDRPPHRQPVVAPPAAPRTRSPASSTARAWRRCRCRVDRRELRHRPVRRGRHEHGARPHRRRQRSTRRSSRTCSATRCAAPSRHIDFLQVNLNEEITVSVPVRLEGEAKAVIARGRSRRPGGRHDRSRHARRATSRTSSSSTSATMTMDTVIRLADIPMPGRRHRRPATPTCRSSPCS